MTTSSFFLSWLAEITDTFQVTNDTGQIVYVVAVAFGAFFQVTLVDMTAVVANGVRNVESEIVAAFAGSHSKQLTVLVLGKVFFKVAVKCRTASKVLDVFLTVKTELIKNIGVRIFNDVEIAVVAVAVHFIAVFLVRFFLVAVYGVLLLV